MLCFKHITYMHDVEVKLGNSRPLFCKTTAQEQYTRLFYSLGGAFLDDAGAILTAALEVSSSSGSRAGSNLEKSALG